jgi:hypothetical protein
MSLTCLGESTHSITFFFSKFSAQALFTFDKSLIRLFTAHHHLVCHNPISANANGAKPTFLE